jgi:hypothetical protein
MPKKTSTTLVNLSIEFVEKVDCRPCGGKLRLYFIKTAACAAKTASQAEKQVILKLNQPGYMESKISITCATAWLLFEGTI